MPAASPYTARAASSVRKAPRNPGGAGRLTRTGSWQRESAGRRRRTTRRDSFGADRATPKFNAPLSPTPTPATAVSAADSSSAADPRLDQARRFSRAVLPSVSRTFALSIKVLPGELGRAVNCAYLLCRIADTIEDAPAVAAEEKAALFDRFLDCFADRAAADAFPALVRSLPGDPAHLELIRHADLVFVVFRSLAPATRDHVRRWVAEMALGMRKFVLLYPRGIRIQSLEEYREYCYYVAGTVGYMLTDLWHEHAPSIGPRQYELLRERSRSFAEALQTVNILKDVARDAEHENSIYVPERLLAEHGGSHATILAESHAGATRAAMASLVALAWEDLGEARDYLLRIPRRAIAIRLFCVLPLVFAYATLREVTRHPDALARREVVKISRAEVKTLIALSVAGVMSNRMLGWLATRAGRRPVRVALSGGTDQ
ncbi:MAG: phytoene/squalene synthase family protein [Gemmatimonadota bacterium]|nr:phytoene/squalene synthase family protein [Gemmatimonadota bacterium]MDE3172067.1 phytoene/squalene synthase family protein [Gemmatimonadota bacterium]MDE3215347.1 phytoene/squalene synthase family protein [Gemmatimonadota bacterium]